MITYLPMRSGTSRDQRLPAAGLALAWTIGSLRCRQKSSADHQANGRIERSHQVIKDNAGPAAHSVIHLADRPGLPYVEKPKQNKGYCEPQNGARGHGERCREDPRDLVEHDRRMIVNAEPARTLAAYPGAERDQRDDDRDAPRERPRARPPRRQAREQRAERARSARREPGAESERDELNGIAERSERYTH